MEWISVESPEDIMIQGEEILIWDGCDFHIDYVDVCPEYGHAYMANGTEPTHYAKLKQPKDAK